MEQLKYWARAIFTTNRQPGQSMAEANAFAPAYS